MVIITRLHSEMLFGLNVTLVSWPCPEQSEAKDTMLVTSVRVRSMNGFLLSTAR